MKIALIYYSDMDFGGAERRLTRIYNEIGKSNYCDLIVRGCDKEELVARIKKADSGYEGFYNINCFRNIYHYFNKNSMPDDIYNCVCSNSGTDKRWNS